MRILLITTLLTLGLSANPCVEFKDDAKRLSCYDNLNTEKVSTGISIDKVKPFIDFTFVNSKWKHKKQVRMFLGYQNNTKKRIIGIVSDITVKDAFGDVILSLNGHKDSVNIKAGKRYKTSTYTYWDGYNSVFIDTWDAINTGTESIDIKITKVIFKDGTSIGK